MASLNCHTQPAETSRLDAHAPRGPQDGDTPHNAGGGGGDLMGEIFFSGGPPLGGGGDKKSGSYTKNLFFPCHTYHT